MQQKIFQLKQINSPQYAELGIGCTMLTLLLVPNQCAVVLKGKQEEKMSPKICQWILKPKYNLTQISFDPKSESGILLKWQFFTITQKEKNQQKIPIFYILRLLHLHTRTGQGCQCAQRPPTWGGYQIATSKNPATLPVTNLS